MKEFQNITKKQIEQYGVQSLSDRPNSAGAYGSGGLSPLELKIWFDKLAAFEAVKINEIHTILASDEAAEYIAIALHENGIDDLSQLVAAIRSGKLASVLELYPSIGSAERVSLQNAIYSMAKMLSDHDHDINEVLKNPPFTESDPTVPEWAKQPDPPIKPTDEIIDSTAVSVKDVPADAATYAEVVEIGGMTYKDGDTLRSAAVAKVESVGANVIPYPFFNTTKTLNGITFTDNGDGSVTANGTATAQAYFVLCDHKPLPVGKYFLSGSPLDGDIRTAIYFANDDYSIYVVDNGYGAVVDVRKEEHFSVVINISAGATVSNLVFKPILVKGSTAAFETFDIPADLRNIEGYGWGINESVYNYIDLVGKRFVKRVGRADDGTLYELSTPVITDISDLLADIVIRVEGGGTVRMVNEYGYDVPNAVRFYMSENETIASESFVGDLHGTAARAKMAETDALGRVIHESYAPAGYGLGEKTNKRADYANIDNIKTIGWYHGSGIDGNPNANITINGVSFIYWYMRVEAWDSNNLYQKLYPVINTHPVLVRYCYAGVWQPWECENPPMATGVEYRTTERWQGKPVYTMLIDLGETPVGTPEQKTDKEVILIVNGITRVIGYDLYLNSGNENHPGLIYTFKGSDKTEFFEYWSYAWPDQHRLKIGLGSHTADVYTAYAIVKYLK